MSVRLRSLIALVIILSLAGPGLRAEGVEELGSRDGDNTVYFRWNQSSRRLTGADSSRMIVAGARVEILTALKDRTGKIVMRGVLRNVSEDSVFHVDGRMIHKVWDDTDDLFREVKSRPLDVVLAPGEEVRARFAYVLPSGRYSARTDFEAR